VSCRAIRADVVVQRGEFTLDAAVHVAPGETVALLGGNGSGNILWCHRCFGGRAR